MRTDDTDQKLKCDEGDQKLKDDYGDQRPVRGKHDVVTKKVIGVFFEVYNELGSGFLESVYREAMRIALVQAGMKVKTEVPVSVSFRGVVVGVFRADLVVNDVVLVELKAAERLIKEHESQTMHYLRATPIEVALLMNFGGEPRFRRFVMDNEMKKLKHKPAESVTIGVEPFSAPEMIS